MSYKQVLKFVKEQLGKGVSKDLIGKKLLVMGNNKGEIKRALKTASKAKTWTPKLSIPDIPKKYWWIAGGVLVLLVIVSILYTNPLILNLIPIKTTQQATYVYTEPTTQEIDMLKRAAETNDTSLCSSIKNEVLYYDCLDGVWLHSPCLYLEKIESSEKELQVCNDNLKKYENTNVKNIILASENNDISYCNDIVGNIYYNCKNRIWLTDICQYYTISKQTMLADGCHFKNKACSNIINSTLKNICFRESGECSKVESEDMSNKNNCYKTKISDIIAKKDIELCGGDWYCNLNYGVHFNDKTVCDSLKDGKDNCYTALALNLKDYSLCKKIVSKEHMEKCMERDPKKIIAEIEERVTKRDYAKDLNPNLAKDALILEYVGSYYIPELCEKVQGSFISYDLLFESDKGYYPFMGLFTLKDFCYFIISVRLSEESTCNKISNFPLTSICKAMSTNDENGCINVENGDIYRESNFLRDCKQKLNTDCTISKEGLKELCISVSSVSDEKCYAIKDSLIKDICIHMYNAIKPMRFTK